MRQAITRLEAELEQKADVSIVAAEKLVGNYMNGADRVEWKAYEYWTWLNLIDAYRDGTIDSERLMFRTPRAGGNAVRGGQVVNGKTLFSRPTLPSYNMQYVYQEHESLSLLQVPDTGHAKPPLLVINGYHPWTDHLRQGGAANPEGDPQAGLYGTDDHHEMLRQWHAEFADDVTQLIYPTAEGADPAKLSKFIYYVLAYDVPACYLSKVPIGGQLREQIDHDMAKLRNRGYNLSIVDGMDVSDDRWDNLTQVLT